MSCPGVGRNKKPCGEVEMEYEDLRTEYSGGNAHDKEDIGI